MAQPTASNSIGSPFIELQTIDSTNKYAMELIHAGMAQHGMTILTYEQTAGKGQRNKKWTSEPKANIAMTIIVKPDPLQLHEQFYLSAAVALAVHRFFSYYAGSETKVKWPNDLYWRDRKAGGILIESVIGSLASVNKNKADSMQSRVSSRESIVNSWQWAIIGIGININQTKFSSDLSNPVSLKQITGKNFDIITLAKELCAFIGEEFNSLITGKQMIIQRYNQILYQLNKQVTLKKENRVFDVIIKGVSSTGKLLTTHAFDEEFDFGSVEWVLEKVT